MVSSTLATTFSVVDASFVDAADAVSAFFLPLKAPLMPVSFAAALRTLFARDIGGGLFSGVATMRASAGGATASVARPSPDFVIDESQLLALAFVSDEADEAFLPLAAVTSVNLRRRWRVQRVKIRPSTPVRHRW